MIKKGIHIVFLFFLCFQVFSQSNSDSLTVNFHLKFDKLPLVLNKKYSSANKDTLTVETFKCYISNIQIQYKDNSVFTQKDSYHLLDLEKPNSFQIPITRKSDKLISKITFNVGIDSLTSKSGAMSGDLDPTKGMYWAWQSGYINMKIEGKSPNCNTKASRQKNEFQFHIGGYRKPYYAIRGIEIPIQKNQIPNNEINISIDLGKLFSEIHLKETNSIMIPCKKAMELADYSSNMFKIE